MLLTLFRALFNTGPVLPALRSRPMVVAITTATVAVTVTDTPLEIRTKP